MSVSKWRQDGCKVFEQTGEQPSADDRLVATFEREEDAHMAIEPCNMALGWRQAQQQIAEAFTQLGSQLNPKENP